MQITDKAVEAASAAMVSRGDGGKCALYSVLKAAGLNFRERKDAVRSALEAALSTIPAPAGEWPKDPETGLNDLSLVTLLRKTREDAAPAGTAEAVGEAGEMPGSNGGFTMAVFKASDVPLGTKLYAAPPAAEAVAHLIEWRFKPNPEVKSPGGGAAIIHQRETPTKEIEHYRTWDKVDWVKHTPLYAAPPAEAVRIAELEGGLRDLLEMTEDPDHDADPEESVFAHARALLKGARATPLAAEAVVKPLEWVDEAYEPGWWMAQAQDLFLGYEVRINSRGTVRVRFPGKTWETFEGDAEAAKAAAQADYEARIRSALVSAPASIPATGMPGYEAAKQLARHVTQGLADQHGPDHDRTAGARTVLGVLVAKQSGHAPAPASLPDGWRTIDSAPTNRAILIHIPRLDYYGNNGVYAGMLVDMGSGRRWITFGHAIGRDLGKDDLPDMWCEFPAAPANAEGGRADG